MAMTFPLEQGIDQMDLYDYRETGGSQARSARETGHHPPFIAEKLLAPECSGLIERPRVDNLLERSRARFPATLITGRAGTGKTALAAAFAARHENAAWFTVESTDAEWKVFARYFAAALAKDSRPGISLSDLSGQMGSESDIARFLVRVFPNAYASPRPSLIILDDIHHLFDTPWFGDFFNLLLYSLPSETHLILLCRSKPPNPLWRLRSKQMLSVLDERVLSFTMGEAETLLADRQVPASRIAEAYKESFGRISRLLELAAC